MSVVHAVITAAGTSSRMGGVDKLTLPLEGTPLIVRSLRAFLQFPPLGLLSVAVNSERVEEFQNLFQEHLAEFTKKIRVTAGGTHRQASILNALKTLQKELPSRDESPVLIHDAARPFVTSELFQTLLESLESCDGVIPALPVRDTVKRVEESVVVGTEDRETLRLVQTPQAFRFESILRLHERAQAEGFLGTDDASLVERYGGKVKWVEGPTYNLKVTVPEDIAILSHLHRQSTRGSDRE